MRGGRLFSAASQGATSGRGGRATALRRSASFAIRILSGRMGWAEGSLLLLMTWQMR